MKSMNRRRALSSVLCVGALAIGATTTGCGPKRQVIRAKSGVAGAGLSGYWNEGDAQIIVTKMTDQMFKSPWATDFKSEEGRKPVVKLRGVIKRTSDRNINDQFFAKQLERAMLNSGKVRVVAGAGQDNINVRERTRQSKHASDDSASTQQDELGADFTLQTIINSQDDKEAGQTVRAYLVNMELVSVRTNEKVWIGEERIVKYIEQASVSWE